MCLQLDRFPGTMELIRFSFYKFLKNYFFTSFVQSCATISCSSNFFSLLTYHLGHGLHLCYNKIMYLMTSFPVNTIIQILHINIGQFYSVQSVGRSTENELEGRTRYETRREIQSREQQSSGLCPAAPELLSMYCSCHCHLSLVTVLSSNFSLIQS